MSHIFFCHPPFWCSEHKDEAQRAGLPLIISSPLSLLPPSQATPTQRGRTKATGIYTQLIVYTLRAEEGSHFFFKITTKKNITPPQILSHRLDFDCLIKEWCLPLTNISPAVLWRKSKQGNFKQRRGSVQQRRQLAERKEDCCCLSVSWIHTQIFYFAGECCFSVEWWCAFPPSLTPPFYVFQIYFYKRRLWKYASWVVHFHSACFRCRINTWRVAFSLIPVDALGVLAVKHSDREWQMSAAQDMIVETPFVNILKLIKSISKYKN